MADEFGWKDLGSYGGEIDTPNLDTLAKNALKFTDFHVSVSCSPTCSMLMGGNDNHVVDLGNSKLFHDVGGETVNIASRMESHGEAGRIQVTEAAKTRCRRNGHEGRNAEVRCSLFEWSHCATMLVFAAVAIISGFVIPRQFQFMGATQTASDIAFGTRITSYSSYPLPIGHSRISRTVLKTCGNSGTHLQN